MRRRAFSAEHPKKGKWTANKKQRLCPAMEAYGTDSWDNIAAYAPTRTGEQWPEHWVGHLGPSVSRETWSSDEDETLRRARMILGKK
jgi:hypothetical protein